MKNPNCDGDHCTQEDGEVRVLPVGGGGNVILCKDCFRHEMEYRRQTNQALTGTSRYDTPEWSELPVYEAE